MIPLLQLPPRRLSPNGKPQKRVPCSSRRGSFLNVLILLACIGLWGLGIFGFAELAARAWDADMASVQSHGDNRACVREGCGLALRLTATPGANQKRGQGVASKDNRNAK